MTKSQLQKELLEKVKPGTKPSHLKRSKSESELLGNKIPQAPPLPKNQEVEHLKAELAQVKAENQSELKKANGLTSLLQEQLKEKQQEIEELRERLEAPTPNPTQELDQSLKARHKSLKDWFKQYQKTQSLDQELSENVEQASEELVNQDRKISSLQSQNIKLKQANQSLARDLNLAQRLAELRRTNSLPAKDTWPSFPSLSLINWTLTLLTLWILTKNYD